jgi:hypothetical protein
MSKDQSTESTEANAEATEAKANAMGVDSTEVTDTEAEAANAQSANGTDETSVNDRLLRESKEWKAKALEAKKELERIKEGEKKKQGKYQELADEYKAKLDKYNRDKNSELINSLKEHEIKKFSDKQLDNVTKFLKRVSDDELTAYLLHILDNVADVADPKIKKFMQNFRDVLVNIKRINKPTKDSK